MMPNNDPPVPDRPLPAEVAGLTESLIEGIEAWLARDDRIIPLVSLGWPEDHPQMVLRREDAQRRENAKAGILRDGKSLTAALDRFDLDSTPLLRLLNHAKASEYNDADKLWPDVKVFLQRSAIRLRNIGLESVATSDATTRGNDTPNDAEKPGYPSTPRRANKAHDEYEESAQAIDTEKPTDREVYDVLAKAYVLAGEAADLPSFATWQRNLREYRRLTGTQKNTRRDGRAARSRNIVKQADS